MMLPGVLTPPFEQASLWVSAEGDSWNLKMSYFSCFPSFFFVAQSPKEVLRAITCHKRDVCARGEVAQTLHACKGDIVDIYWYFYAVVYHSLTRG